MANRSGTPQCSVIRPSTIRAMSTTAKSVIAGVRVRSDEPVPPAPQMVVATSGARRRPGRRPARTEHGRVRHRWREWPDRHRCCCRTRRRRPPILPAPAADGGDHVGGKPAGLLGAAARLRRWHGVCRQLGEIHEKRSADSHLAHRSAHTGLGVQLGEIVRSQAVARWPSLRLAVATLHVIPGQRISGRWRSGPEQGDTVRWRPVHPRYGGGQEARHGDTTGSVTATTSSCSSSEPRYRRTGGPGVGSAGSLP